MGISTEGTTARLVRDCDGHAAHGVAGRRAVLGLRAGISLRALGVLRVMVVSVTGHVQTPV